MIKRVLLLFLPVVFTRCDFGPAPLNLGEKPRTNGLNQLTIPLNVTKAFSPTGYFYNVWSPAIRENTWVDPEKWNNFLAYQSVFQHPTCQDRVSPEILMQQDSTLPAYIPPGAFYDEFVCSQFTYAPMVDDDLYGGVFWLRNNNFGNHPGVPVVAGARRVRFWARTTSAGEQKVKFGVGVSNNSTLKPWFYFSPNVDTWGIPDPKKTPLKLIEKVSNTEGLLVDSLIDKDSLYEGNGYSDDITLTNQWKLFQIDLDMIYASSYCNATQPDGTIQKVQCDSIPEHQLIGAFYWAMEKINILNSNHITAPIKIHRRPPLSDTVIQAKYGSATILVDGIRYEK